MYLSYVLLIMRGYIANKKEIATKTNLAVFDFMIPRRIFGQHSN
jgi:hypothetical protein